MIRRNHQNVAFAEPGHQIGQLSIEILERLGIALHVVPVPIQHIRIDKVRKDEVAGAVLQKPLGCLDARRVVLRMIDDRDPAMAEDVFNLADRDDALAPLGEPVQNRRLKRRERIVLAVFGARVMAARAGKGPRDHAAYKVFPDKHLPRDLAHAIQFLERNHIPVRRDLKHAVRARIHDRAAGSHMLVAELLNDRRAGRDNVADRFAADARLKRVQKVPREPVRIR